MKVTVDFDGTLTRADVQRYVRELLSKDVPVMILTSRYGHVPPDKESFSYTQNKDLFDVAERLGLGMGDVVFTNGKPKGRYMSRLGSRLHLENCPRQVDEVMLKTNIVCLDVRAGDWQSEADYVLGNK